MDVLRESRSNQPDISTPLDRSAGSNHGLQTSHHEADYIRGVAAQRGRALAPISIPNANANAKWGKNRSARLTDAMASAKESVACLEVAVAVGYVGKDRIADCLAQLDHLVAALWNIVHRPWR